MSSRSGASQLVRPLLLSAVAGVAISAYLTATKLSGGLPACGPVQGCETVALSAYSEIFGVPVAGLGLVFSCALFATVLMFLRGAGVRALYATYALSLFGVVFVGYLTYLELFVIHAICIWCVGYAVAVVATFALAVAIVRSARLGVSR